MGACSVGDLILNLILVAGILFTILFFRHMAKVARRRSAEMAAVAADLGLEFREARFESLLREMSGLDEFLQGNPKAWRNLMLGETTGISMAVFDQRLITGVEQGSATRWQTMVCFITQSPMFPRLHLSRALLYQRIARFFGLKSMHGLRVVDLPSHPQFTRSHFLLGGDEDRVRAVFDAQAIELFESHPDLTVWADGDKMAVFRKCQRAEPSEVAALIDLAKEAFALLCSQTKRDI